MNPNRGQISFSFSHGGAFRSSWLNDMENILSVVCIPVHLLMLVTIGRNWTKAPLNCSYFKILFSITLEDLVYCLCTLSWNVWVQAFDGIHTHPVLSATLKAIIVRAFYRGEQVALVAVAVNRMINIKFALTAARLWRPKHTVLVIVLQYSVVTVVALLCAHPNSQVTFTNETRIIHGVPSKWEPLQAKSLPREIRKITLIFMSLISAVVVIVIYGLTFKARHDSSKATAHANSNKKKVNRTEVKLAAQGLVLSVLLIAEGLFLILLLLVGRQNRRPWMLLTLAHTTSANFFIGPFVAFIMSADLRHQAKILLLGDKVKSRVSTRNRGASRNVSAQGNRVQEHKF